MNCFPLLTDRSSPEPRHEAPVFFFSRPDQGDRCGVPDDGAVLRASRFRSLVRRGKGAASADALVVPGGMAAYDIRSVHFNAEMLSDKVHGCQDGKIGVSLAAAGSSDPADPPQRFGGHPVGQGEGFP